MKKTIREWLMMLKDEHRDKAIKNMTSERGEVIELDLGDAIANAFNWSETDEGGGFWGEIYDDICNDRYFATHQQTPEDCVAKAKESLYGLPVFPEDDSERQKYPLAQTDLFFPEADAAFSNFCLLNQQKHCPEASRVTWAKEKSVGDGSQLRRHLLEFLKAVESGDMERADMEIKSVDWRGRELSQRWHAKMPPFDNLQS